jgi:uncharacterized protein YggE
MRVRPVLLLALNALVGFAGVAAAAPIAETIPSVTMVGEAEQTGTPDIVFLTVGSTLASASPGGSQISADVVAPKRHAA